VNKKLVKYPNNTMGGGASIMKIQIWLNMYYL